MTKQKVLVVVSIISFVGVLFSGYLSYMELFAGGCNLGFIGCGASVAELPACVYGLFMYTMLLIFSAIGIRLKK